MKNFFLKILWVILVIFLLTIVGLAQTAKVPERLANIPVLERKVDESVYSNSKTINDLTMESFSRIRAAGGFAMLDDDNWTRKYNFKPKINNLKDILDSIIEVEPLYQWKEEKGLIILIPKNNYSVLETQIANFYLVDATKEEMMESLQKTPEFQSAMQETKVERDLNFVLEGFCTKAPQRNTINLQNVTVMEILNEIVRLNGFSVWRYREYSADYNGRIRRFYKLDFMVNFGADCNSF